MQIGLRGWVGVVGVLALCVGAWGDKQADEISLQRALDQPFNLTLQKVELSEAFKQIAATAKIALQVDPACYEALPYGATTRVTADFRESKLRDAIEEVLLPLGLQQTISGSTVIIRPSAALAHIGRRAEWDELKLLQDLRTGPDLKPDANGSFTLDAAIRAAMDRPNLTIVFSSEGNTPSGTGAAHDRAIKQITSQLPISAFRALEMYCQLTNQIWFVEAGAVSGGASGGTVQIMPMRKWIERQMERPIQMSFTNAPLEQVVAELSHMSGVRIVPEPGLYEKVPVVTLNSNNGSVLQTLEALAGATRIAFDVREDSILLHMAGSQPVENAAAKPDTIVGRVTVAGEGDGPAVDIFIRESDLSPEMNEMRKKKVQAAVDALEKAWTEEPATKPAATHPAK